MVPEIGAADGSTAPFVQDRGEFLCSAPAIGPRLNGGLSYGIAGTSTSKEVVVVEMTVPAELRYWMVTEIVPPVAGAPWPTLLAVLESVTLVPVSVVHALAPLLIVLPPPLVCDQDMSTATAPVGMEPLATTKLPPPAPPCRSFTLHALLLVTKLSCAEFVVPALLSVAT